jgi:hypothetical protein
MKLAHAAVLGVALISSIAMAGQNREWKTGIVTQTAHATEPPAATAPSASATVINAAPGGNPYAVPHANLPLYRKPTTWQAFRIEGNGYRFDVMCPVHQNHSPDVTVNGPIRYAMEKGKFYLLDEDGKEWEMTVIEKVLLVPQAPTPPPSK